MEIINNITLHNADCLDILKTFRDNQFDLAVVDVPYGIKESMRDHKSRGVLAKARDYEYKEWDLEPPTDEYFSELFRVSKNQIIWGANHFISKLPYDSSCWLVWDKDNGKNDFADCELAWTSLKTAVRKFKWKWHGMLQEDMKNKEIRIHPTQKPVQLYKWVLSQFASKGDIILDTHSGSLSIGIACFDLGFELTAIELDDAYYESGKQRLKSHITKSNEKADLGYAKTELEKINPILF